MPIIQGSLFLKPEKVRAAINANVEALCEVGAPRRPLNASPEPTLGAEIVAHHLRLVGHLRAGTDTAIANPLVIEATELRRWAAARRVAEAGRAVVLLRPQKALRSLDLVGVDVSKDPNAVLRFVNARAGIWTTVWSLHSTCHIEGAELTPILTDEANRTLWAHRALGPGHLFLIGTDLAADLMQLRQGDPMAAHDRPTEAQWDIPGERPTYLFEKQLGGRDPYDRPADWWIWGLRAALEEYAGIAPDSVLPGGATGAIVVTGDDDQAPLADYRAQRAALAGLPTTYFLHPMTKLDAASMAEIGADQTLEWEIHPDALETPNEYPARLAEQVQWFKQLTGRAPRLVRNHGFLNDGYWGHATAWLAEGLTGSSNLPGLDGRVLNGSLLPARLALDGALSSHWSILTAFGDGVSFVLNWDARKMFEDVVAAGRRIKESRVPGILVLNLHPANVVRASAMHDAVKHLVVAEGFASMTLGAALDWFAAHDRGESLPITPEFAVQEGFGRTELSRPRDSFRQTQTRKKGLPGQLRARLLRLFGARA